MRVQQKEQSQQGVQATWQEDFLSMLPQIERNLNCEFRYLDPEARDEAVADGIANSFVRFERLARDGRTAVATPTTLAQFAIWQYKDGRTVAAKLNRRDPLTRYARLRGTFTVERLDYREISTGDWVNAAVEDRRASVPEQVALRIDLPAWLGTFTRRTRRIARDLGLGFSTGEVARKYHLSAARISQLRRELRESWDRFHGLDLEPRMTRSDSVVMRA